MLDTSKISNLEFEDIDYSDYPDFCDTFVSYAECDGEPMTEEQLDDLNENHREFVYDKLMAYIF